VIDEHRQILPRAVTRAGLALLALSLVAIPAPDAFAQSTAAQKGAEKSAQAPGPTDTVIVSKIPERKGPVYSLLKKLFCKNHGGVTGASNSEVCRCLKRIRAHFQAARSARHEGHQAA